MFLRLVQYVLLPRRYRMDLLVLLHTRFEVTECQSAVTAVVFGYLGYCASVSAGTESKFELGQNTIHEPGR